MKQRFKINLTNKLKLKLYDEKKNFFEIIYREIDVPNDCILKLVKLNLCEIVNNDYLKFKEWLVEEDHLIVKYYFNYLPSDEEILNEFMRPLLKMNELKIFVNDICYAWKNPSTPWD